MGCISRFKRQLPSILGRREALSAISVATFGSDQRQFPGLGSPPLETNPNTMWKKRLIGFLSEGNLVQTPQSGNTSKAANLDCALQWALESANRGVYDELAFVVVASLPIVGDRRESEEIKLQRVPGYFHAANYRQFPVYVYGIHVKVGSVQDRVLEGLSKEGGNYIRLAPEGL